MHKVVLEVSKGTQLNKAIRLFTESNIEHVAWTEQPENILTAIATAPYSRAKLEATLKKIRVRLFSYGRDERTCHGRPEDA